jgi:hypothetical protein
VTALIDTLHPRDRFSVGVIQSCSFTDAARIVDVSMPDRESGVYTARPGVRAAWQSAWTNLAARLAPTRGAGRTDLKGALLYVSQQMRANVGGTRRLIIFSDMVADYSPDCRQPSDAAINLHGADVIIANMIRTPDDTRDPDRYGLRQEYWRSWLLTHGAASITFAARGEVAGLLRPGARG